MIGDTMIRTKEYYKQIIKEERDYKALTKSFLESFFFGGLLCVVGTVIYMLIAMAIEKKDAMLLTSMIVIALTSLLTGIGIYDKLGQIAKCGLAIPISGFANACISSAMEYKKEGLILGIASNCLKLAGAVLVLGVTSAFLVSCIRYLFWVMTK